MVIIGLSPGLANQMYEYAAAYAFSRELNQELVLDISECINAPWGFLLDFFSIPTSTKMIYFAQDYEHGGHTDIRRIPEQLREKVTILTQEVTENTIEYSSLSSLTNKNCLSTDTYLCGYFFDREKYYDKYWEEIKNFFSLKVKIREVDTFRALIKDKISVGIHIRRGDMLLADWAEHMEDDYYRAAIQYCRKYIGDCSFFIFSDDIEYAKKMLGKDSSLWYVNFGGSQEADVAEFICLTLCDHRILSNSSTFSRLANELSTNEKKKTFYQGKEEHLTWYGYIKRTLWLKFFGKSRQIVPLDKGEIRKYSKCYRANNEDNIADYQNRKKTLFTSTITTDNCETILEEINTLFTNIYENSAEDESRLLYQKFNALIVAKEYDSALAVKERIYEEYSGDSVFQNNLVKALTQIGACKEASIEANRVQEGRHFIIIPAGRSYASGRRWGLIELGIVLHHFGHKVSFILEPVDESEKYYINSNQLLTDRHGNCQGCWQYLVEKVEEEGVEQFLGRVQEDELFIITRRKDFCGKRLEGKKTTYIFPDFTDWRDAESKVGKRMPKEEIDFLYQNADIVLTREMKYDCKSDYVLWQDNDHKEIYWNEKRRWKIGELDRLSERTICMAEALLDKLKEEK